MNAEAAPWQRGRRFVDTAFLVTGSVLTLYIVVSVFGLVRNSAEHYTNFLLAIVVMSALLGASESMDKSARGELRGLRRAGSMFAVVVGGTLGIAGALYLRLFAVHLERAAPYFGQADMIAGYALIAGVALLTWLHWGFVLTSLIVLSVLYFFFGHLVPHPLLMHPPYEATFVMNYVGLGLTDGMFWLGQIAADSIFLLIIYAAVLLGTGMLTMVLETGKAAGRHVRGGAALPAIVGSGIVASVMGQATANIMLTGRMTIPTMNRHGYRREMSGAIEAVASASGQILPPILGLAGFIIAATLNRAYIEIALAALIPGLLFLSGLTIGVLVYASRNRLPRLTESVDTAVLKRMTPTFVLSFGAVLLLLANYYSPAVAGLSGIVVGLLLVPLQGRYRPSAGDMLTAFRDGLYIVTVLSLLLIAIGPLAQSFLTTNVASRVAIIMLQVLPDSKLLMLGVAMVVALILGLGLPTPVAYLVVALVTVPFLQFLDVPELQSHFFVFYFAVFSALSPPVAIAALAASKVSGGSFFGTVVDGMKLMATVVIVPYAFVYHPELLSFPHVGWSVVAPLALTLTLQWTVSVAAYGYFRRALSAPERVGFLVVSIAGLALIIRDDLASFATFTGVLAAMVLWVTVARPGSRARPTGSIATGHHGDQHESKR